MLDGDDDRCSPAVLGRLQALLAWSAPTHLESRIIAYAFVHEWSHAGIRGDSFEEARTELRQKVLALGRELADDAALFDRMAPRIWQTRVHPVEWLGQGFAEGAAEVDTWLNPVVAAFQAHAPKNVNNVNVAFLAGCLQALYESDTDALPDVLERLLDVSDLRPHAVDLLVATPLSPWASAEIVKLACAGEIAARSFEAVSLGGRHEAMSDKDFASLINAVSALPRGYLSAFSMIAMRLFNRKVRQYEPTAEVLAATRNALGYLLKDHRENWDAPEIYGLKDALVLALGPTASGQEISELVGMLCDGLREGRLAVSDLDDVAGAFVLARPEALLDALHNGGEDNEGVADQLFHQHIGCQVSALNQAALDRLLAWCGTDQSRIEHAASYLTVYVSASGGKSADDDSPSRVRLSEHFEALLAAAPNKEPIIDVAAHQAVPRSWSNSRARIIEARAQAFTELLSNGSIEVQAQVREKLDCLHDCAAKARDWEATEDHSRARRFE